MFATAPVGVSAEGSASPDFGETTVFPLQWRERPTAADYERHYPREAFMSSIAGRVVLDCLVQDSRRLECAVAEETPRAMGFGEAAIGVAQAYRMSNEFPVGGTTAGARVSIVMRFSVR